MEKHLPIGKAARLLGVHPETLRKWTVQGKVKADKTLGGHRRYTLAEVQRVKNLMDGDGVSDA